MSTIADITRLTKTLLNRNPDLYLVGRLVVVRPVHHVVRGIFIGQTRTTNTVRPIWAANCLFDPLYSFHFTYGYEINPKNTRHWDIDHADFELDIADCIEEMALPRLRALRTVEDYYTHTMKGPFFYRTLDDDPLTKIYVDAARGDFEAADVFRRKLEANPARWSNDTRKPEDFSLLMQRLCPLIASRDRAGIAALLHEVERQSVQRLKLEKIWQPSPFPIEM